jgi:hypothetical protein
MPNRRSLACPKWIAVSPAPGRSQD